MAVVKYIWRKIILIRFKCDVLKHIIYYYKVVSIKCLIDPISIKMDWVTFRTRVNWIIKAEQYVTDTK